jgi:peptidoglycan/LPS O-acetylase OafA/YrhL
MASSRPMKPSTRIDGLDTLRATAIILVVLEHYALFVGVTPSFEWITEIGWVGVDLFFALSGYLIGNQVFAALRSSDGFSASQFYARRALRTLPAFYVVLAMNALWPAFRAGRELPPLWEFLTFTQNINLTPGTAFSHAWSLCVEEQFYLLLPLAAVVISLQRRSLRLGWTALAAVVVAGMLVRSQLWAHLVEGNPQATLNYYKYIYYSSLCRLDELVAGVALAMLRNYHGAIWQRITSIGNAVLMAGLALSGLAFYLFMHDYFGQLATVLAYPILAAGFALLVLAALSPGSLLARMRVPGAQSIALWSYSIYLLHKQLCVLMIEPLRVYGIEPATWPSLAISLVASALTGWLLYRLVETPFMALRAKLR